jgi:small-conductance mechanosensitive channel
MSLWEWLVQQSHRVDPYGNTVQRWLIAISVVLVVGLLLLLVKRILAGRIDRLAAKTHQTWPTFVRGLLDRTRTWFLLLVAIYCGSLVLSLPDDVLALVRSIAIVGLLLQAALWGNTLLNFAVIHFTRQRMATDAASATTISVLGFLGKLALWTIVVLVALDNLGVNVTALVAGMGIGGIAVALAAQNILGDLFASLAIMLDRPFVLGDSIAIEGFSGTVENIGVKTTRLRSVSGEELIFSNSDLLKGRIRNFKRMSERRVQFSVKLKTGIAPEQIAAVPQRLREIVESQGPVRFDRAHFRGLEASGLQFEVVYFVLTPGFNQSLDIQQAVNLAIMAQLEVQQIKVE